MRAVRRFVEWKHASEGKESNMDASMIRIICAVLAVALLGLIVMRRKKNAE